MSHKWFFWRGVSEETRGQYLLSVPCRRVNKVGDFGHLSEISAARSGQCHSNVLWDWLEVPGDLVHGDLECG